MPTEYDRRLAEDMGYDRYEALMDEAPATDAICYVVEPVAVGVLAVRTVECEVDWHPPEADVGFGGNVYAHPTGYTDTDERPTVPQETIDDLEDDLWDFGRNAGLGAVIGYHDKITREETLIHPLPDPLRNWTFDEEEE